MLLTNARTVLTRLISSRIRSLSTAGLEYKYVNVEVRGERKNVGVITLNRPKALNALCDQLMVELSNAIDVLETDKSIATLVLTGSQKAFAAGADIKEMSGTTYSKSFTGNMLSSWDRVSKTIKPIIAAVNGYALGGGCELALMCDIIYAGENAKFGQPEIAIGTIPGAGGTQRLTRIIGKSRAMEMVLSGIPITAKEAESCGMVSKVFPSDKVLDEAIKLGEKIGSHSKLITAICKESVNNAYETTLQQGLRSEKRLFHSTFATSDCLEGMKAFIEKRAPNFKDE